MSSSSILDKRKARNAKKNLKLYLSVDKIRWRVLEDTAITSYEFLNPPDVNGYIEDLVTDQASTRSLTSEETTPDPCPLWLLGYCFTPYQRLWLYNGAPFSRLLRHAGDTEDVFSAKTSGVPTGTPLIVSRDSFYKFLDLNSHPDGRSSLFLWMSWYVFYIMFSLLTMKRRSRPWRIARSLHYK